MDRRVAVGMFVPRSVPDPRPSTLRTVLAAMAGAGLDHVGTADHVSFHGGWGVDGLVEATALAACGDELEVHVGVYLLALRHPVPVARQVATFAERFPGRLTLGVGVGGEDRHEIEVCGVDPATRGRRTDECLGVLRRLLAGETVDHDGDHVRLRGATVLPAPSPPVPIVVGGRAAAALARAGRLGDGWLGIWSTPQRYRERLAEVEAHATAAGRDPASLRHGLQLWAGCGPDGREAVAAAMASMYCLPFERFERFTPHGDAAAIADALWPYVEAGCTSFSVAAQATDWREAVRVVGEVRRRLNS